MTRRPLVLAVACLASACTPASQSESADAAEEAGDVSPAGAERWRPIMRVVVGRMDLAPGERVYAAGLPGLFDELPEVLAAEVEAAGGVYVGTLGSAGPYGTAGDPAFVQAARGQDRAGLRELLRDVPVGVMLPGTGDGDAPYGALNDLLDEGPSSHRAVHFHWGGAYEVEHRSIPIGAEAVAAPAEEPRADDVYRRAIVEVDYDAVAAAQQAFEAAARNGEIRVTTPAGTDIRFRIGDRPVNRQDGDVSAARALEGRVIIDRHVEFPIGALRVAPLESTVEGVIAFPRSRWGDVTVENLLLGFEQGRITSIVASVGEDAVRAELDAAGEAAAFRELGVGFNPELVVPEDDPWLPYFGYGAGVVRLSLGDNSELGGAVGGGYVKWVFFLDASVEVDGVQWVRDGRMLVTHE